MSNIGPLRLGDEIRVIAPSDSYKTDKVEFYQKAGRHFQAAGYKVSYGDNVRAVDYLGTANAALRAQDFNDAFKDPKVTVVIAMHGGFFSNEILPFIDWTVVRANPKLLVGYSDITVLLNAVYAKTGITSLLGPNFGTFGHENTGGYSLVNFLHVLRQEFPIQLEASTHWFGYDGAKQASRPWTVIHPGEAEAVLLGGNIQSFYLLQGTQYQPLFTKDFILAAEADGLAGEYTLHEFSRSLESFLQLPGARAHLRGIIIGRFTSDSNITDAGLAGIIATKNLGAIPVVANVDFGHTRPIATLPIGGRLKVVARGQKATITIESL